MDEQRRFGHRMGDIAYLTGFLTGVVGVFIYLWYAVTVAGGMPLTTGILKTISGWFLLVMMIIVPSIGVFGWSIIGNKLVDREMVKQRRREARAMADEIMNEPDADRQKQLIALYRMKFPGIGLCDAAGD